jgi:hypothetical protein
MSFDNPEFFNLIGMNEFTNGLISATPARWISMSLIKLACIQGLTDEVVQFINTIDKSSRLLIDREDDTEQIVQFLTSAFVEDHTRLGVFNLLSQLTVHELVSPKIPYQLLSLDRYNDSHLRQAAIILQLTQQDWESFPPDQLVVNIAEMRKDENQIVEDVLRIIERHKMVGVEIESFLMKLYLDFLEKGYWQDASKVWAAIDNSLRQRHSNLLTGWSDLGLPEGLDKLVRTQ